LKDKFIKNGEINLHYKIVNFSPFQLPVIFIPGLIINADEFYADIKDHIKFYSIIIDRRGLGKSDKPETGYSADDFIYDIRAIVKAENLEKFNIAGHSFGAGIACAYTVCYPAEINKLILADYPPVIPALTAEWAEMVRQNYPDISENFLNGMINDCRKKYFTEELLNLPFDILFLKGSGEESLLKMDYLEKISAKLGNSQYKIIGNAGHEVFGDNPADCLHEIEKFIGI